MILFAYWLIGFVYCSWVYVSTEGEFWLSDVIGMAIIAWLWPIIMPVCLVADMRDIELWRRK